MHELRIPQLVAWLIILGGILIYIISPYQTTLSIEESYGMFNLCVGLGMIWFSIIECVIVLDTGDHASA